MFFNFFFFLKFLLGYVIVPEFILEFHCFVNILIVILLVALMKQLMPASDAYLSSIGSDPVNSPSHFIHKYHLEKKKKNYLF